MTEPDLVRQLRELAGLHDAGLITDDEFARAKSVLLGGSQQAQAGPVAAGPVPPAPGPPAPGVGPPPGAGPTPVGGPPRPRPASGPGRRRVLVALGLVVVLVVAAVVVARYVVAPAQYRIAFTLDEDRNRDIAVVNLDGSGLVRIASDPQVDEAAPSWSPDGSQIAYVCDRAICVVDAGGGSRRTLTNPEGSDRDSSPAWSPDGSRIAFDRYVRPGQVGTSLGIVTMRADGQDLRDVPLPPGAQTPAWSPDGTELVFALSGQEYDIWASGVDGSNLRPLYEAASYDYEPHFSPDGRRVAFVCGGRICLVDADGRNVRTIADGSNVRWFADGDRLVVACEPPGRRMLCDMTTDGTDVRPILSVPQGEGYWPDPSPVPLRG